MAKPAPVIKPKGERYPGSGRKKGTPNRITVEVRQLVAELVNSASYQHRLRRDFDRRKVHPTIESLVWAYYLGKPTQPVTMQGSMTVDVSGRLEEERRIFAQLDIRELEELAAESQRLVDRARMLTRTSTAMPADLDGDGQGSDVDGEQLGAETLGAEPQPVVVQTEPIEEAESTCGIAKDLEDLR